MAEEEHHQRKDEDERDEGLKEDAAPVGKAGGFFHGRFDVAGFLRIDAVVGKQFRNRGLSFFIDKDNGLVRQNDLHAVAADRDFRNFALVEAGRKRGLVEGFIGREIDAGESDNDEHQSATNQQNIAESRIHKDLLRLKESPALDKGAGTWNGVYSMTMKTSPNDVSNQEILNELRKMDTRIGSVENSNQEIIEALHAFAGSVDERFDRLETRMDKSEFRLNRVESQMVTKDYLDDKLADQYSKLIEHTDKRIEKALS